jgi:hypothetical protein
VGTREEGILIPQTSTDHPSISQNVPGILDFGVVLPTPKSPQKHSRADRSNTLAKTTRSGLPHRRRLLHL